MSRIAGLLKNKLFLGVSVATLTRNVFFKTNYTIREDSSDKLCITNINYGLFSIVRYWDDPKEMGSGIECSEVSNIWFSRPKVYYQKMDGKRKQIGEKFMYISISEDENGIGKI
jgi:hypothetical protein